MSDARPQPVTEAPMVQHFDPFRVNRYKPADPRYLERQIAMQRESRAVAAQRHPRETRLRVADFWRLYYQNQGTVEAASAQVHTARGAKSSAASSARSGGSVAFANSTRSVGFADDKQQQQQQQQQQGSSPAELNAPIPAGGSATCIGVVDGGLTVLIGRDNGRVAVVDGLRGRLVQDIDVALAARQRVLPRRREVQAALKLQSDSFQQQQQQQTGAAAQEGGDKPRALVAEGGAAPAAADASSQQQQQQQQQKPLCVTDAQEQAMEKDVATKKPRDAVGLATEPQPVSCITPFTPRGLGRPMFLAGSEHGRLFLFDATTLTYLAHVDLGADDRIEEMRWLAELGATTELIVRNRRGDLFVVEVAAAETPSEEDVRNIDAEVRVSKRRDAVPPKHARNPPPTVVSMVALGGTVWVGDAAGGIHTLDDHDLGRVLFASEDFPLYAVQSDADDPAVNALAVGGSFCYAAVENRIHVLPLTGMPKDCIPLSTLTAHTARVVSLDFDHATGRLWSRDVSGRVACYDGTSKSGFALRTTMQLPATDGAPIRDIKFCSYETHVRLWTLASNGLNKQWCSGFAAGSTDATNQASLNEADIEIDGARTAHWTELVARQLDLVGNRRAEGARALQAADDRRVGAECLLVWQRYCRLRKFLRIQPLHAQMLTVQADMALIGRTFRRWMHWRLERRLTRIHAGGCRLLLQRVQHEALAAYFRRWVQLRELRRQRRAKEQAAAILGRNTTRVTLGTYYDKLKAFALRGNLRHRREDMGKLVADRWAIAVRQSVMDTFRRYLSLKRSKRLAVAAVGVMEQRLNTLRMQQALSVWQHLPVVRRRRTNQRAWAQSMHDAHVRRAQAAQLHFWLRWAAARRERRREADNAAIEGSVAEAQGRYMANQAHIDRVRLLKNLRRQLADLQQEQAATAQRLEAADAASKQSREEMVAARDRAANPAIRGTVIQAAEVIGRALFGRDPGADLKATAAAAKEGPVANAKGLAAASRSLRDAIDASEVGRADVPVLDTEIDALGARLGRDKAAAFVDDVRKIAAHGLATSVEAVADEEVVDTASRAFVLSNVDGLAQTAVRLRSKPPPALVVARAAASARSGSARARPSSSAPRSGSATGKKAAAAPTGKAAAAAPKPAAKRPVLRGKQS